MYLTSRISGRVISGVSLRTLCVSRIDPWHMPAMTAIIPNHSTKNVFLCRRCMSQSSQSDSSLTQQQNSSNSLGQAQPLTFGEKVKENTRSTVYGLVIVCGVCVTGALLYSIGWELMSDRSSTGLYSTALHRCTSDNRVLDALGRPVKAHGETNSRGRRRHVAVTPYTDSTSNSRRHRLKFYLQGSRHTATVHADIATMEGSKETLFRYLFVEVDNLSRQVIVLEDNRASTDLKKSPAPLSLN